TERSLGLPISLAAYQKNSVIVVALREVRVDGDGGPIRVLSAGSPAHAGIKRNQVGVALSQFRILLHRLLMLGDGALELAGVLQIDSSHKMGERRIVQRADRFQ